MLEALLKVGFMDNSPLRIHDWAAYNEYHKTYADRASVAAIARWAKAGSSPSIQSPTKDKDKDRGVSITTSNASSIPPALSDTERISLERELERIGKELSRLGKLSDYSEGTLKWNRVKTLTTRQTEIRTKLGVVA